MRPASLLPLRESYTKRNGKSEVRAFLGETLNEKGRTFNPTLPLLGLHCFATLVIGRLCSTPPSCGIQHGSSETQHFSTTGRPGNPPWHTALFGSQPNSRLVSVGDCRRARNVNGLLSAGPGEDSRIYKTVDVLKVWQAGEWHHGTPTVRAEHEWVNPSAILPVVRELT